MSEAVGKKWASLAPKDGEEWGFGYPFLTELKEWILRVNNLLRDGI